MSLQKVGAIMDINYSEEIRLKEQTGDLQAALLLAKQWKKAAAQSDEKGEKEKALLAMARVYVRLHEPRALDIIKKLHKLKDASDPQLQYIFFSASILEAIYYSNVQIFPRSLQLYYDIKDGLQKASIPEKLPLLCNVLTNIVHELRRGGANSLGEAIRVNSQLMEICKENKFTERYMQAILVQVTLFLDTKEVQTEQHATFQKLIKQCQEAANYFQKKKNPVNEAMSYHLMGIIQYRTLQVSDSIASLTRSLELLSTLHQASERLVQVLLSLSFIVKYFSSKFEIIDVLWDIYDLYLEETYTFSEESKSILLYLLYDVAFERNNAHIFSLLLRNISPESEEFASNNEKLFRLLIESALALNKEEPDTSIERLKQAYTPLKYVKDKRYGIDWLSIAEKLLHVRKEEFLSAGLDIKLRNVFQFTLEDTHNWNDALALARFVTVGKSIATILDDESIALIFDEMNERVHTQIEPPSAEFLLEYSLRIERALHRHVKLGWKQIAGRRLEEVKELHEHLGVAESIFAEVEKDADAEKSSNNENLNSLLERWSTEAKKKVKEDVPIDFAKNLKSHLPFVSPKETKLCYLLHLGYSTEQIVKATGSTFAAVRKMQYRISKKLPPEYGDDIVLFLFNYLR